MCRKTCRSCVQKQAAFCGQRVQSRPEIFFRGGNYDRNTEKTAFADYDIRSFRDLFTGYPHVWSIYQPYVMEQAGWSQGQASMCFYLALSTFVFGNIVGGRMQNRFKEKTIVWIGGGIFAAGILASAFLIVSTPLPMYLSYGVMQGFGQGMIYTVILATVQRWFPDRTGFASGVVVTANGLCGFFLAPLSRKLLEAEACRNLSDHWGSHRSFLDPCAAYFFRHPIRVW